MYQSNDKLREQMQFLRTSLRAFYEGEFAESALLGQMPHSVKKTYNQ
jgi:hypothetical protein